jgi:hypothetical protein
MMGRENSVTLSMLLLAACIVLASNAAAQSAPLPAAADVIARFVKEAHLDSVVRGARSMRSKASFEMPGTGVSGTVTSLKARPNSLLQVTSVAGLGESKTGFDGTHGWVTDVLRGPRILEGAELADLRVDADFAVTLRDTTNYKVRETVELAEYAGQKCYKVRLVSVAGRESFDCFSVESGLLVASQRKVSSPMGSAENVLLYSDYRAFGRVLMAGRIVQEQMGRQRILTLESVTFDDVQPAELALPPEVRALIKP